MANSDSKSLMKVSCFDGDDVEIQERQWVYTGFFKMEKIRLRHRLFQGGWSQDLFRELFVRGSAVAAVMYDPVNQLIGLIEQFRIGALKAPNGPWLCEVVAGMTEPGESSRDVILRELLEEADITPNRLISICDYYSSPGGSDERLSLYCALGDLSQQEGVYGLDDEGEDIRVVILPQQAVFDQLYNGRFNNAATLICLQWLQLHHQAIIDGYNVEKTGKDE